jgi:hypothetical protein
MKRLALVTLSLSFALAHFASAEDDNNKKAQAPKQQAYRKAAAAQPAGGNQARFNANRGNRAMSNTAARQQFQAQRNGRNFTPALARSPIPSRNLTPRVVTGDVPQANVDVNNAGVVAQPRPGRGGNGNWRDRNGDGIPDGRNHTGQNRDWNGNNRWNHDGNNRGNQNGNNRWDHNGNNRWTRNWDRGHHDRSWWRNHYSRFSRFGGGYYYWDSGFWYPAYGYDPYFSTYSYDAPVYAYNDLDPAQVIANVQEALQRSGYYHGTLDGQFGPMTREALLNYQSDNGLDPTGEIDQSTLESLGLQ